MGLIDTLARMYRLGLGLPDPTPPAVRSGFPTMSFNDAVQWMLSGSSRFPVGSLGFTQNTPSGGFVGYVNGAYASNGIVFACELARFMLFSEARFQFRERRNGVPGKLFGTAALAPLETPMPRQTTGDLLARMLLHADLGGNAFPARTAAGIRCLRPDWTDMVLGSTSDPVDNVSDVDAELVGLVHYPGGKQSGAKPVVYRPGEFAHFAPIPDPLVPYSGMPWLTPIVREIAADDATTTLKLKFFENGATPNLVVTFDPSVSPQSYDAWVDAFEAKNKGAANAWKTVYLGGGTTLTPVGRDFQQVDFKAVQGAGETRIAAAAGVPPVIAGFSEGLQGSSLNAGNYGSSRRRFADLTMRPLWRNAAGSLAALIEVPAGAELWYDDRDIPFLQEDMMDEASIVQTQAQAIRTLVDGGYTPDSAIAAVVAGDLNLLAHTGLFSVQLQPPGAGQSEPSVIEQVQAGLLTENEAREIMGRAPIEYGADLSPEERGALIEEVKAGLRTENEARGVLGLPPMVWDENLTPEENAMLLEQVRAGVRTENEAREALKLPPMVWSDEPDQDSMLELVKAGVVTENEMRERMKMPPIQYSDGPSPDDIASLAAQVKEGLLTIDEARAILGRPPVEWPEDLGEKVTQAGELIKAGFDPADVLAKLGLPPIKHLGLPPTSVQKIADAEGEPPVPEAVP